MAIKYIEKISYKWVCGLCNKEEIVEEQYKIPKNWVIGYPIDFYKSSKEICGECKNNNLKMKAFSYYER